MFICLRLYLISESVDREGKTAEDTGIVLDNTEDFFLLTDIINTPQFVPGMPR